MKDPRYGHVFNLKPLSYKDIKVSTEEYDYYFRVCGEIKEPCGAGGHSVASCQVKKMDPNFNKVAGTALTQTNLGNGKINQGVIEEGFLLIFYI